MPGANTYLEHMKCQRLLSADSNRRWPYALCPSYLELIFSALVDAHFPREYVLPDGERHFDYFLVMNTFAETIGYRESFHYLMLQYFASLA